MLRVILLSSSSFFCFKPTSKKLFKIKQKIKFNYLFEAGSEPVLSVLCVLIYSAELTSMSQLQLLNEKETARPND